MRTKMIENFVVGSAHTSTTFTTVLFVTLSFIILMMLIKKFAWGPITTMLSDRAQKISDDIDGAEQANEKAKTLLKKREDELVQTKAEAAGIVREARENAEKLANSIVTDAKQDANHYREKARKDIELEREQIIESAKREVADLSVQIASKILKKELSQDTHKELIDSYIEGLGKRHED